MHFYKLSTRSDSTYLTTLDGGIIGGGGSDFFLFASFSFFVNYVDKWIVF